MTVIRATPLANLPHLIFKHNFFIVCWTSSTYYPSGTNKTNRNPRKTNHGMFQSRFLLMSKVKDPLSRVELASNWINVPRVFNVLIVFTENNNERNYSFSSWTKGNDVFDKGGEGWAIKVGHLQAQAHLAIWKGYLISIHQFFPLRNSIIFHFKIVPIFLHPPHFVSTFILSRIMGQWRYFLLKWNL